MADTFRLYTDGLLSKWGFGDGDVPEELLDYCDARGEDYPRAWREVVLPTLITRVMVPSLDQVVAVELIGTCHNPVRAVTVDGQPVDDRGDKPGVHLTPEWFGFSCAGVIALAHALEADEGDLGVSHTVGWLGAHIITPGCSTTSLSGDDR